VVSAGAYVAAGHHIAPHDDRAHRVVAGVELHSRAVAVVYHLCADAPWQRAHGGLFVDMEDASGAAVEHAPAFNTLFAFRIPRWHAVTPLAAAAPRRLSLFGWFLARGKLYELHTGQQPSADGGDEEEGEEEEEEGSDGSG
jgi:Rps23 Pro-64 3,4-dihydroxylase Tpa1-like proline 4-hydroxylase